jgi:hypothetical protein
MSDNAVSHPFGKDLYKLAEKVKCLRDISRAEVKRFDDLWNSGQNKVMGLDGKISIPEGWVTTMTTQHAVRGPLTSTNHIKQRRVIVWQQL